MRNVKRDLQDLCDNMRDNLTNYEYEVIQTAIKEIELLEQEIRQQRKQVRNLSNSPWDAEATQAMR